MTLAEAEAARAAARDRLRSTLAEIRSRAQPGALARDLGERGAAVANRNPATIGAVALALTLFLARHRIAALFTRKRRRR